MCIRDRLHAVPFKSPCMGHHLREVSVLGDISPTCHRLLGNTASSGASTCRRRCPVCHRKYLTTKSGGHPVNSMHYALTNEAATVEARMRTVHKLMAMMTGTLLRYTTIQNISSALQYEQDRITQSLTRAVRDHIPPPRKIWYGSGVRIQSSDPDDFQNLTGTSWLKVTYMVKFS